MSRKELFPHLEITLFYFLVLTLLRFGFLIPVEILFFISGGVLGNLLLDLDHFLYVFYTRPEDSSSISALALYRERKYREMILLVLSQRTLHRELVLHSALFGPILFILALFVLTSSGSFFGAGLVLGIFIRYLTDIFDWYRQDSSVFSERFFWQFRGFDYRAQKIFLFLLLSGFIFCSLLFIL